MKRNKDTYTHKLTMEFKYSWTKILQRIETKQKFNIIIQIKCKFFLLSSFFQIKRFWFFFYDIEHCKCFRYSRNCSSLIFKYIFFIYTTFFLFIYTSLEFVSFMFKTLNFFFLNFQLLLNYNTNLLDFPNL